MKLRMNCIKHVSSAMVANSGAIDVECEMNERQMHDALLVFLEHIDGETWQSWVDEINEDSP